MRAIPIVLLAAGLLFCAVAALPASRSGAATSESDDVELILPKKSATTNDESDEGTFHVDAIYTPDFTQTAYGNPFYSNFGNFGIDFGFASRIQDIIRRLYATTPEEPELGFGSVTDELFGVVPDFNTKVSSSDPQDKQDDDKTETTSTVKIINGHKYVINDTITTKNTRYGQSVFKVRTVDILPLDDDEATADATTVQPKDTEGPSSSTTTTGPPTTARSDETVDRGSPEVLESDTSNEISHNGDDAAETFETDILNADLDSSATDDQTYVKPLPAHPPLWVHHSTHEDLMSEERLEPIPDQFYHHSWESAEQMGPAHTNSHLDQYEIVPNDTGVDLSNDISVNQMLADQGVPADPDAEVLQLHDDRSFMGEHRQWGANLKK